MAKNPHQILKLNWDYTENKSVRVISIESPSSFKIEVESRSRLFEDFEGRLSHYYAENASNLMLSDNTINKNWTCAHYCEIERKWKRGRIIATPKDGIAQLEHVDNGTKCDTKKSNVYYLVKEFSSFPQNCRNCRLSNVVPTNSKFWTKDDIEFFKNIVSDKTFTIDVRTEINDTLYICLDDYELMENIDHCLVMEGHAAFVNSFTRYYPFE